MSAMTHNDEKDGYKNNTLVANYSQKLSDEINFKSNLRLTDTYKQYDKEVNTSTATHNEEENSTQSSANLSLEYKNNDKFSNELSLSQNYIRRIYNARQEWKYYKDTYGGKYSYGYKGN